jgi:hypothetical protein
MWKVMTMKVTGKLTFGTEQVEQQSYLSALEISHGETGKEIDVTEAE